MKQDDLELPFYTINEKNELYYLNRKKIITLPTELEAQRYILQSEGVITTRMNKITYPKTILVIEPHPDDFVLSALPYTLKRYNVQVLNVFSKMMLDSFTWKDISITEKEYENLRLTESKYAIEEVLGEKFNSLKEQSTRITTKNKEIIEQKILRNIKKVLKQNKKIDTIMIPMGIGNHPDHMIVYQTIMNNRKSFKDYKLILYPEYPYARSKYNYLKRLEQVEKEFELKTIIMNISNKLEIMAELISIYRSQFDDINRSQMLALIREDGRSLANDFEKEEEIAIFYEVGDPNEN